MESLYAARATAVGGREGSVTTDDGLLSFALTLPKGLGGMARAGATNPEQLFACGYSACFGSAIQFVAKMQKVAVGQVIVNAEIHLNRKPEGGLGLSATLRVKLPDVTREQAQALVDSAHQVCPYSNATRGNMSVEIVLE